MTLVQTEPFRTLGKLTGSPPAAFRMIAPGSSEEPISLAETQAELKASGSIPGNLWYCVETLVRDNTGAGMLAQILNCAGISLQLISGAQDPAKNICSVKVNQVSEVSLGCTWVHATLQWGALSPLPPPATWLVCVNYWRTASCFPPSLLTSPSLFMILTSRGKQRGSKIRGLRYNKQRRLCWVYILLYKHKKSWSHKAAREITPSKYDFSSQDYSSVLRK